MSNSDSTGFGQFVPGFEFLQKLAQGGQSPMSGWVAPTLDPKALDKRIEELKAVQFWLDQNATALKATIQALEVQKMTLATLGSMNVNLADFAARAATPKAPAPDTAHKPPPGATPDPVQYWGALTRQFQQIAASALQDVAARTAAAPPAASASASAAPARKAARKPQVAAKAPARKKSA